MSDRREKEGSGDLVFIGDVHLDRDDPDLEAFLSFLDGLRERARRVVLMGDLFNLWIGREDMALPHHRAVTERLERLRAAGLVVRYVEGNRDYRIADAYLGRALDDVTDRGIEETAGGLRLFAIHGDLANRRDRQYRTWRALSRSWLLWQGFRALSGKRRLRLAESLETRMRGTNLAHKREFPEDQIRAYATRFFENGADVVVLGHFHVERDLQARAPSKPGRILVLPEWKGSRRHLRVSPRGEISFVDSRSG